MSSIKVRAKGGDGVINVKALISHPMDTGLVKDKKTGKIIPAHFIQEVICQYNGKTVITSQWGPAVSKNPYLAFRFAGDVNLGDTIQMTWVDNQGEKDKTNGEYKLVDKEVDKKDAQGKVMQGPDGKNLKEIIQVEEWVYT
jgi:sulfur-oxidizing protein SoxZ